MKHVFLEKMSLSSYLYSKNIQAEILENKKGIVITVDDEKFNDLLKAIREYLDNNGYKIRTDYKPRVRGLNMRKKIKTLVSQCETREAKLRR